VKFVILIVMTGKLGNENYTYYTYRYTVTSIHHWSQR